jgi:superoxide dismutase, Cu-Zn family
LILIFHPGDLSMTLTPTRFARRVMPFAGVLLAAVLSACGTMGGGQGPAAVGELQATRGNVTTGAITFTESGGKVVVQGEVRGLKPGAEHGFHVHEKGDCSSGDGMSTGGHFNPDGKAHGQHGHMGGHHAGDLPSLVANAQGVARVHFETRAIRVADAPNSVAGRGLIVHRDPDDYKTQPTGNAGPRLACAVIRRR